MIVRTEYSARSAFGTVEAVLARLPMGGIIADESGCWGHCAWVKAGAAAGKAVGLGARLRVAATPETKTDWREVILVATSAAGLRALYGLVTLAHEQFYWWPRLTPGQIPGGAGIVVLATPARAGAAPPLPPGAWVPFVPGALRGHACAFSDNRYPAPEDREAWSFALGERARMEAYPQWVMGEAELKAEGSSDEALARTRELLARAAEVSLPKAENVRFPVADAGAELRALTEAEFARRRLDERGSEYRERLERELRLIGEKGFADYLLVIWEMVAWAKERMLVGPGRGSSAGSIVCWLLRITEVDPLAHKLLFERFIDPNRFDLPDVDLDFPDDGRETVLQHLADKYGAGNVAHIGTLMRYKARSALDDVAKELRVPLWELDPVKDGIIERFSGDSRVNMCLLDTLQDQEAGRALLAKYPLIAVATKLEGGVRQFGKHAAGMIVCNEPVEHFCAIARERVAQIDKKSAETLNILKIDALGLRTLSVLQLACGLAGLDYHSLYDLPLEDEKAFAVLNSHKYCGVFQLEGYALQSLAGQFTIQSFDDIAALTALARPGPLGSGAAIRWIDRHEGREEARPAHPALAELTKDTHGEVIFQETVMQITRELGNFSWADTAKIRKLMSDRKGDESFQKFEALFLKGCAENKVDAEDAQRIWKAINTMGSWAFNKCIAGGTLLRMADTGGKIPLWLDIETLYERYRLRPSPWIKGRGGKLPRLWSLDEATGRARAARPTDVVCSGKKFCVRLTFRCGAVIECTEDHKFLINGAWRRCGSARIGAQFAMAQLAPQARPITAGKDHAKGKKYGAGPQEGFPSGEHNPAWANGRSAIGKQFRAEHAGKRCEDCGGKHRRMEVHHEDRSEGKINPADLHWLCPGCHKRRHYKVGRTKRGERGLKAAETQLIHKEPIGLRMTYDVVMPEPNHNFLVNGGIVTHNSHAVVYGLLSYWCAWLKAHHPLEFAAACLRHAKDNDSARALLRELAREGVTWTPVDAERSAVHWTVQAGRLVGGLLGIKGIGAKIAAEIVTRRQNRMELTPRHKELLGRESEFVPAKVIPTRTRFGGMYENPSKYNISVAPLVEIVDSREGGQWCIIGRLVKKTTRDANEEVQKARRGGTTYDGPTAYLIFFVEDDSGRKLCRIDRFKFERLGRPIVEKGIVGETWLALRGRTPEDFEMMNVEAVRWLD